MPKKHLTKLLHGTFLGGNMITLVIFFAKNVLILLDIAIRYNFKEYFYQPLRALYRFNFQKKSTKSCPSKPGLEQKRYILDPIKTKELQYTSHE